VVTIRQKRWRSGNSIRREKGGGGGTLQKGKTLSSDRRPTRHRPLKGAEDAFRESS